MWTLRRQGIEARRRRQAPVAPNVSPSNVIAQDEDDVRTRTTFQAFLHSSDTQAQSGQIDSAA